MRSPNTLIGEQIRQDSPPSGGLLFRYGMRTVRLHHEPASHVGKQVLPDATALSDDDLETAATAHHPLGTCKMGHASDELAVVDP
jgi:choline dehydrogenase-like flavoprotein